MSDMPSLATDRCRNSADVSAGRRRGTSLGCWWQSLPSLAAAGLSLVIGFGAAIPGALASPREAVGRSVFVEPVPNRVPVVLVPGWGDEGTDLEPLRDRLLDAGWPESRILLVAFDDPYGSSASHAPEIGRAVASLLGLTGAPEVDIVAHSMGGLAVRAFLESGETFGDRDVRRAVFLGTPHRGTVAAMLAWGDGGREMIPGSSFLERLNAPPPLPEGVEALAIRTPVDLRVIPGSSAMLPDARNVEVCCPTHQGLLDDPAVFREVRLFLLHGPEGLTHPDDTLPPRGGLLDRMNPGPGRP